MGNLVKKMNIVILAGVFVTSIAGIAIAQHDHHDGGSSHSSGQKGGHSMPMTNRSVQAVTVNGFKVTLDVMDMSMHASMMKGSSGSGEMDHGKSHAIMVTIQDTASKELITDAKVSYTLTTPSGEKETGDLNWSGDHYGGGFNPKEKGTYQVQVKIESGGTEREANFKQKV